MLSTLQGATAEAVAARLANRMERQRRVMARDDPPQRGSLSTSWRCNRLVGSTQILWLPSCDSLLTVATLPRVTLTVMPSSGTSCQRQ